jgi:hypothetical protein
LHPRFGLPLADGSSAFEVGQTALHFKAENWPSKLLIDAFYAILSRQIVILRRSDNHLAGSFKRA